MNEVKLRKSYRLSAATVEQIDRIAEYLSETMGVQFTNTKALEYAIYVVYKSFGLEDAESS